MYREDTSTRRSFAHKTDIDTVTRAADLHLCAISENGSDRYLSGEILPHMRITGKSLTSEIESALREIFKQQRIDVSELGKMPLHLVSDHRGNAESWRMEYTNGWGAAARRLLEKTRSQETGAWVDL